jgi:hypothetical protein
MTEHAPPQPVEPAGIDAPDHPAHGSDGDRRAYIAALIAARCPEIAEAEKAQICAFPQPETDGGPTANWRPNDEAATVNAAADETMPMSLMTHILTVVEALDERMAGIEQWMHTMGRA